MSDVDTEALAPDEVTGPGTDLEPIAPDVGRDSALVAAAEAALAAPDAIDHSEFWALAAQARILCMSGAAPPAVRRDPHLALHLALVGRDLGISASASLELIDIIETRRGSGEYRLSLSPQLMNGQLRRLGIGCILPAERTNTRCVAVAFGPGGPDRRCTRTGVVAHVDDCACDVLGTSEFTWEDARIAELVGPNCQPGQHVKDQTRSSNGRTWKVCGCNQGYVTYPKRMLWWRASGFAGDDYFPEAGLGLYSPEALGSSVDEHGRPIDVESVELPPGYEPAAVGAGSSPSSAPAERMADPDELWELQARLHALPEGHKDDLKAKWVDEDSRLRGWKPHEMPHRLLPTFRAMVNSHWGKAKGADIDMDYELLSVRRTVFVKVWLTMLASVAGSAAQAAPEALDEPAAPKPAPEPEAAQEEPQSPDPGKAVWASQLASMAEEVRELGQGLPEGVADKIGAAAKAMHWKLIDNRIAAAGAKTIEAFPPTAPIDLRRMAVCALMLEQFRATGELPPEVESDG
jgi:hypothetical protein